jgi:putative ABC transport system substrate-binding protein
MKRRAFIALASGTTAVAWLLRPRVTRAQLGERMRTLGVISVFAEQDAEGRRRMTAFVQGLQQLGWADRRNLRIDYRWTAGSVERTRADVDALVAAQPDAMLVNNVLALPLLQRATRTIPIVFVSVSDPVATGFVASLARPGGNFTGFTGSERSWGGKLLELLKEVAPRLEHVAVILHPDQQAQMGVARTLAAAGSPLGVRARVEGVRDVPEIERVIDRIAGVPNGGLVVLPTGTTNAHRTLIIERAARLRLPAAYAYRYFVTDGGLISYGADPTDQFRRAASYVDRILRGEKPADLPVQQPTRYELAINLKTAKALGLEVSPMLLARADEVIE